MYSYQVCFRRYSCEATATREYEWTGVMLGTVQYISVQYSTLWYCTVHYGIVQYSYVQYST